MSNPPLVGARRFETYVRWSVYLAVATPVGTLLRSAVEADRLAEAPLTALVAAAVLCLLLVGGNVLVTKWGIDTVVGHTRGFPVTAVVGWALVLAAFVAVSLMLPLPAMDMTVAAAIASAAASLAPALRARRALLLHAAALVLNTALVGVGDVVVLLVGALMISAVLWLCWSSAWMLRVLLELQAAHEDRAALALANERLRISRDLHDVFGRTLAAIAVKSSLASELVRRGHGERAATEISAIRGLAEEAGTEVRRVVRGELRTTWEDEVSGARSLLRSAGIRCTVTGDPVPELCAEPLAWVVREGVTNLLRHASATQVTLATANEDGEVHLTVANDGAGPPRSARDGEGTGLRALSERLHALGGHVTARRDGDWFLLDAVLPLPKDAPR
ncbi:histidine kinase [Nocardiopsis dassonvillei]|uniref:sensor histidine kinase n=1 Tax=Nocardiopsis dassonvillei TaxID=2014 RepID=UPI0020A38DFD|nr:histidine kinase [Nocardiopsis dassonvillei]MCP3012141.1 histidine kinase [Nocardiopsis dassonvillei]